MKKYEQIILKFKIKDLKIDEKLLEVQQQLSLKGDQGFKLINSHIHSAPEVNSDTFRFLFCIMEREYYEAEAQSANSTSDAEAQSVNSTSDDDWS